MISSYVIKGDYPFPKWDWIDNFGSLNQLLFKFIPNNIH